MHPGQLELSLATVRALVDEQFPQWRDLPLTPLRTSGTVNAIVRVGGSLAARFPLQAADPDLARAELEREAAAAEELQSRIRFATPKPIGLGAPGHGYPMPWAVQTWLAGTTAEEVVVGDSVGLAHDLAELVGRLRALDVGNRRFRGAGRGGDLHDHDAWVQACLRRSAELLDVDELGRRWSRLCDLPRETGPDVLTHGDLIPPNLLVADGRLSGVLDVGGLGPTDPSLDLVPAWAVLEARPRAAFRADLDCSDLVWARGQAWAFEQALGLVEYYQHTNPPMSRLGRRTLERILADPLPA